MSLKNGFCLCAAHWEGWGKAHTDLFARSANHIERHGLERSHRTLEVTVHSRYARLGTAQRTEKAKLGKCK